MRFCADLHAHSVISDGEYAPEELVAMARRKGLRAIAIADHDTVDGVDAALAAGAEMGVEVIPAVEISATEADEDELHILGYWLNHHDPALGSALARLRSSREERMRGMCRRLQELGLDVPWQRLLALAGDGAIGRPHLAQALREAGHVASVQEAFDRYLSPGCPAFVPRAKISAADAIGLVRSAGGLTALAHPWGVAHHVARLSAMGLAALEARYANHGEGPAHYMRALAREHGLLVSGGSDFHGPRVTPGICLGDAGVTYEELELLRAAAGLATRRA